MNILTGLRKRHKANLQPQNAKTKVQFSQIKLPNLKLSKKKKLVTIDENNRKRLWFAFIIFGCCYCEMFQCILFVTIIKYSKRM